MRRCCTTVTAGAGNASIADGRVVSYTKGYPPGTHEYIDYGYLLLPARSLTDVVEAAFDLRGRRGSASSNNATWRRMRFTNGFTRHRTPEALDRDRRVAASRAECRAVNQWAVYFDRGRCSHRRTGVDWQALCTGERERPHHPARRTRAVAAVHSARGLALVVTNQPTSRGARSIRQSSM